MISFFSETEFSLDNREEIAEWISGVVESEGKKLGDVSYIFCSDEYLLQLNKEFLQHDTYTDIISFDYSLGDQIHGEVYISIDRIKENAKKLNETVENELHRVIIHGILHYCGYKDKQADEIEAMRNRENQALKRRAFL